MNDAYRFLGLDELPHVTYALGLMQKEPWSDLSFLRGREVPGLALSAPAADCDLSAIADLKRVETLNLHGWTDLSWVPMSPDLKGIQLSGNGGQEIDVRPLRNHSVNLFLSRRNNHVGTDELGPDVKIQWID